MPIVYNNGITITGVVYNNTQMTRVYFWGPNQSGYTMVFSTITTSTPTIQNVSAFGDSFSTTVNWRVRNNDGSSALIRSDINVTPPTTSRGTIASNGLTATLNTTTSQSAGTIYATAQVINFDQDKNISAVASASYNSGGGGGCYLTSAMVDYFGYEDDGEQLNSMRTIRSYMYKTNKPEYIEMLRNYAKESKKIINHIQSAKNSLWYYEEIKGIVLNVVSLVKEEKIEEAMNYYWDFYLKLKKEILQ